MKPRKLTSILSIALTGHRMYAALLRRSGGRLHVARSCHAMLALDPLNSDPQLVGREIRRHLDDARLTERHCIVSLPLRWSFMVPVDVPPELPEEDRRAFLDLEAERHLPFDLDDLVLSVLWPRPHRATVVAMPYTYLNPLLAGLAAARLKPVAVTVGLAALPEAASPGDGIDLLVAQEALEMAVRVGDGPVVMRTLDDAIVYELDSPRFEIDVIARQLRITVGQLPPEWLGAIRTVRLHGAPDLVRMLADQLQPALETLNLRVATVENPDLRGGELEAAPQVLGAAQRCLLGTAPLLDFLPRRESRWARLRRRVASRRSMWLWGTAAAAAALAAGTLGVQSWKLHQLQRRWDAIADDVARAETLQARLEKFRPWYEVDAPSLRILSNIAQAFPQQGTVWVTTLKISESNKVTCQGKTNNGSEYYKTTDALRQNPSIQNFTQGALRGEPGSRELQYQFEFTWKPSRTHGS